MGFDDQRIAKLAIKDTVASSASATSSSASTSTTSAPVVPGGANRWIQSLSPEAPRVAYRRGLALPSDLPPEFAVAINQTKLKTIVDNNSNRFQGLNSALRDAAAYPVDDDTQLSANAIYRSIKEAKKKNVDVDEADLLTNCFDKMKAKRGFSKEYLTALESKIKGALVARPANKPAKALNRAIN
jgi:hypothetical protein